MSYESGRTAPEIKYAWAIRRAAVGPKVQRSHPPRPPGGAERARPERHIDRPPPPSAESLGLGRLVSSLASLPPRPSADVRAATCDRCRLAVVRAPSARAPLRGVARGQALSKLKVKRDHTATYVKPYSFITTTGSLAQRGFFLHLTFFCIGAMSVNREKNKLRGKKRP